MSEKRNTTNQKPVELKGKVTYEDKVIEKIIGKSLEDVKGLFSVSGGFLTNLKNKVINSDDVTEGINVEVGTKQVAADLKIVVEYNRDIPEIVKNIKRTIQDKVGTMTHLEVVEVNIDVVDIQTKEEFEEASVTLQDRVTEASKATGEFISETTSKAGEAISETTSKAGEAISETTSKAGEAISDTADKVKAQATASRVQ